MVLLSEDILPVAVQITVIGGAIWSIISYMILAPLNDNIKKLEKSIDILTVKTEESTKRNHELELRLVAVEARTKSLHDRLDVMLTFIKNKYEDYPAKDR